MNAQRNITIDLRTTISFMDEKDVMELKVFGTTEVVDNVIRIYYIEENDGGNIYNTIQYDGESVLIIRSGEIDMKQAFIVNKKTEGTLVTSEGSFNLTIATKKINYQDNRTSHQAELQLTYDLFFGTHYTGLYEIEIRLY